MSDADPFSPGPSVDADERVSRCSEVDDAVDKRRRGGHAWEVRALADVDAPALPACRPVDRVEYPVSLRRGCGVARDRRTPGCLEREATPGEDPGAHG